MSLRLQPLRLTCPCCRTDFTSSLVIAFDIVSQDQDLCPRYAGPNPMAAMLHLCPRCGFCGYEADYRATHGETQLQAVRRMLHAIEQPQGSEVSGPERYRRAALIGVYLAKPCADIAMLYLEATWCSRLDGEPEGSQIRSARKAIEYFTRALKAGEIAEEDLGAVHYSVAELKRQLGHDDEAIAGYEEARSMLHTSERIKALCDEQAAKLRHKP